MASPVALAASGLTGKSVQTFGLRPADHGQSAAPPTRDDVEPLTADFSRIHATVSRRFLKKLAAARDGLAHAIPGATTEQVLEAGLDLLLERQARARAQVKRPRKAGAATALLGTPAAAPAVAAIVAALGTGAETHGANAAACGTEGQGATEVASLAGSDPPPARRAGPRDPIPAAVRRAVWQRDAGRCSWPLDSGGCCGSTQRLELDHIVPWARWGDSTEGNLRVVCRAHNRLAARRVFGERVAGRYAGGAVAR
jgi:hypothetical protein